MWNPRSLRLKTLGILGLLLCAVGALSFAASAWMLDSSLGEFEQRVAQERVARVASAIQQDVSARVRVASDYGFWDDAAAFMSEPDEKFLTVNFTAESLRNAQVAAVAFFGLDGHLHAGVEMREGRRETLDETRPLVQRMRDLVMDRALAGRSIGGDAKRWVDGRPLLMVFSPVRRTERLSPQLGWLVMLQGLDEANLRELSQTTGASFRLLPAAAGGAARADSAAQVSTAAAQITQPLRDALGESELLLQVDLPPALERQRQTGLLVLLLNSFVLVLLAGAAAVLLLDRLILRRLAEFARLARRHRGAGRARPGQAQAQRWPVQGQDELDELALALNGMVGSLDQARAELERDVRTDALTGLGNRRQLYEQIDQLLGQKARHRELTLALLLIDLDDFKLLNDSLGHELGNHLLVQTGQTLKKLVRASDVVTRLGGDEFALIYVAEKGELGVLSFVRRLQQALAQPVSYQDMEVTVTGSIGIAYLHAKPGQTINKDDLLRNAELAMYAAKRAGKGRYSLFNDALLGDVQERMLLEQQLRECLRQDQLEVWFQPILDVRTGEVAMFEALARWPLEGGYCSPARFIPVAEETGLINELGAAVARKVIAALPALLALDARHVVNVNLSPRQLMSRHLVEQMCSLVDGAGLSRDSIHFELTESALASNADFAKQQLDALAAAGFHLHLDDFGTGYSSLHRLQSLPFSTLKLDRSFVVMLGQGDARIARSIISLAEQLGLQVIAEGIETLEQQERLLDLGCHLIQGYLHAKPMPLPDLLAWLARRG